MDSNNYVNIMKVINDLLVKIGTDKVLHFFGGGFLCAILAIISLLQDGVYTPEAINGSALIGTIVTIVLIILKELFDKKFDLLDIAAGLIGCAFIWLAIGIGFLLNYLSAWKKSDTIVG